MSAARTIGFKGMGNEEGAPASLSMAWAERTAAIENGRLGRRRPLADANRRTADSSVAAAGPA